MAEIKFPKIEIEPADLARLEALIKRFEDAAKILEKEGETRILFANDYPSFYDVIEAAKSGDIIVFKQESIKEQDTKEDDETGTEK